MLVANALVGVSEMVMSALMGDDTAGDIASISADTDAMLCGRGRLRPRLSLPPECSLNPRTDGWRRLDTTGLVRLRWGDDSGSCDP